MVRRPPGSHRTAALLPYTTGFRSAYDRRKVDGCIVPAAAMRSISAELSTQSIGERAAHACIGQERADLVVAGCAILEAILDAWPAQRLKVADRGIREEIGRAHV